MLGEWVPVLSGTCNHSPVHFHEMLPRLWGSLLWWAAVILPHWLPSASNISYDPAHAVVHGIQPARRCGRDVPRLLLVKLMPTCPTVVLLYDSTVVLKFSILIFEYPHTHTVCVCTIVIVSTQHAHATTQAGWKAHYTLVCPGTQSVPGTAPWESY